METEQPGPIKRSSRALDFPTTGFNTHDPSIALWPCSQQCKRYSVHPSAVFRPMDEFQRCPSLGMRWTIAVSVASSGSEREQTAYTKARQQTPRSIAAGL